MGFAEIIAWTLFSATCLELAFLQPYLYTIYGSEADIIGGFLCALSLMGVLVLLRRKLTKLDPVALAVSLLLLVLAMASGLFSDNPGRASVRAFILMTTGLGGFWCSRMLLSDDSGRRFYVWLCSSILVGFLVMSIFTFFMWGQTAYHLLDPNPKTLINRILLLSFGPIAMISMRSHFMRIFGIVLLGTSYLVILGDAVFFGRFIHTAAVIFVVLALLALVARRWRLRELVLVFFGGVITVVVAAYVFHPVSEKVRIILSDTRTLYRIESYPSSWHIASQHPLFGIGLGSRVLNYLEDYHSLYAQWPTPKLFKQMVAEINNPDSAYPALMIFLGIPFTVIYLFALLVLLGMLFRALWRPPPSMVFHPLALAVPVLASMMHFVDLEGLLYDDISWFFHILLGMIPISTSVENRGGK